MTTEIAHTIFPNWSKLYSLDELERLFPVRDLPKKALVTRISPSPTGMMHIGGIFTALINHQLAHQTGGIFYLRIEDTDQKRVVEGAYDTIIDSLIRYGLTPDEGPVRQSDGKVTEVGVYGPYVQTERKKIYQSCVFDLIKREIAYPCFLSEEELNDIRIEQTRLKLRPGIYGTWARSRNFSLNQIKENFDAGKPMVVRLRSPGNLDNRISWNDGIRGELSMPENDLDVVLLKSDGIPTYHLAHIVDDHFMRTTDVIRADEWLPSVPLHLQLFNLMGWEPPRYAHISALQKEEGSTRRKLSKRKDPEANVDYYDREGFPQQAVFDYLLNLANSNFEDWRKDHPDVAYSEFPIELKKINKAGALTDSVKLKSISKEIIAKMGIDELYENIILWAKKYDTKLAVQLEIDPNYAKQVLNIEREGERKSKRLESFSEVRALIEPFYNDSFLKDGSLPFPKSVSREDSQMILRQFMENYDTSDTAEQFFERIKAISEELEFSPSVKDYKKNPSAYKGHVGDVAAVIRVALFGTNKSPDIYEVAKTLGWDRIQKRCMDGITALS
ncbi:MAG: glutamate--tRNA ligase [Stigonema ocellatum SAG 48.90 = DSM 106950]|nr:glutamate--tRNA ligase [Stigonema ocellatum SAG 48.90 = DSM 106950]